MATQLKGLHIRNFRSLADITIKTDALNVLFGPNGAGKSTFLDAMWFVRDCLLRGVDQASSERGHGIGMRWIGAGEEANIAITLETELAEYEVVFGYSSGRIEPFVGERLHDRAQNIDIINRKIGSKNASFYHATDGEYAEHHLRDPEKLALRRYLDLFEHSPQAAIETNQILQSLRCYLPRHFDLTGLQRFGSESNYHTSLTLPQCRNLWSVLRNLQGKIAIDERYDTIILFMRKAFPDFQDFAFEQTGPNSVYASALEKGLSMPIQASEFSEGHLQLLILLTALFSEGNTPQIVLFDEPELSLHPHALAIFAEAVELAVKDWDKQIFIATHSPVLISQFAPANILAFERDETRQTVVKRVSEIENIQDLLEQYATGSLYMAELIAPQSKPVWEEPGFWEKTEDEPREQK